MLDRATYDELLTPLLEELYPILWLVARGRSDHIDALHLQLLKGREIVIAEDPDMHLVWSQKTTYVKPIPARILSQKSWSTFFDQIKAPQRDSGDGDRSDTCPVSTGSPLRHTPQASAAGFVRSYDHLIIHPSDLKIAQRHGLVPSDWTWEMWDEFVSPFRQLDDRYVSRRYHYGQLRLSRLHWAVRIYGPPSAHTRWFYQVPYWSIGLYVQNMIAPIVFVFASLSVVLSAMQVMSGGGGDDDQSPGDREAPQAVIWWFCVVVLAAMAIIWTLCIAVPLSVLIWQVSWGYRHRLRTGEEFASSPV